MLKDRLDAHLIKTEEAVMIGIHVLKQLLDLAGFVHGGESVWYKVYGWGWEHD